MGIILGLVFLGYLILAAVVIGITARCAESRKTVIVVALLFIIFPFRRLIFYETLFYYYSRSPLQEIHETVESPVSVYWEDNVWPGFDEYGRHWMVKNYLDGAHLKVLALNGDDGNIYLYRATIEDFTESRKILSEVERAEKDYENIHAAAMKSGTGKYDPIWVKSRQVRDAAKVLRWQHYEPQRDKEVQHIMSKAEVYTSRKNLPPVHYLVRFDPLPLPWPLLDWLHGDRISIIDVQADKEIAFSRRYMAYAGLVSRISGEVPKFDYKLGDIRAYEFDDKVLFRYAGVSSSYESKRSRLDK